MLSAKRKRRFFDKLDEIFVPSKRPTPSMASEAAAASAQSNDDCVLPAAPAPTSGDEFTPAAALALKPMDDRRQSFPPMQTTASTKKYSADRRKSAPLPGLLQGKSFLIVPVGEDMSRRRIDIWTTQIIKAGGRVVKSFEGVSTIVVASLGISRERLLAFCHLREWLPGMQVVTPDWLIHFIQHQCLPPVGDYAWTNGQDKGVPADLPEAPQRAFYESTPTHTQESQPSTEAAPPALEMASPLRPLQEDLAYRKALFYRNNPDMVAVHEAEAQNPRQIKLSGFVCTTSSVLATNLNTHLTSVFEELIEYLAVEKDEWRENSYKRMVSILKQLPSKVTSADALRPQFGFNANGIAKIREILETGTLRKLEAKKSDLRLQTLRLFANIWGVGPVTAQSLYSQGYRSLEALAANGAAVLNDQQRIGLQHYADFLVKIPRAEVEEIEAVVKAAVAQLNPRAECVTCGSYRRGKAQSGDVDILVTDPTADECALLPDLLKHLHKQAFLTDDLTHVYEHHTGGCDSYMGVCRVDQTRPFRRIDLKVYPRRLFGFAILYFTGSDHFNRSMRAFAKQKGYSLTDRGLTKVARAKGVEKLKQAPSLTCPDEKDVFIALQLPYKVVAVYGTGYHLVP
ncbi:DNA polymerase lambda-like protein [Achlya hypogyna]|uniref:DNA polymerase n=1 Tax=Achlya hypogyna TaxID=1202772 RepID=A0A1V9Y645_ACHHY|nr:DNA polymerase lambda-like protein [Achlya hypogyna]